MVFLFFWFLAPVLLSALIGGATGVAIGALVDRHVRMKHASREAIKGELDSLSSKIGNDLKTGNYNSYNISDNDKKVVMKDRGETYGAIMDKEGNLRNVIHLEYDTIDYELNNSLNNLKSDNVLIL